MRRWRRHPDLRRGGSPPSDEAGIGALEAAVEGFAQKLGRMGLLERSVSERSTLQLERLRAERQRRAKPRLFKGELLRMRWSLGDPNAAFDRWLPRLGFFFSRGFIGPLDRAVRDQHRTDGIQLAQLHAGFAQLTDVGSYTAAHAVLFWCTLLPPHLITSWATASPASTTAARCMRWVSCCSTSSPPSLPT